MPDISARLLINTFCVLGALFALTKGGIAERWVAGVVIFNVIVGQASGWLAPGDTDGIIRLVNDGLAALLLLVITIRYGALWMGGVMLFFAAQFTLHSFYLVTERPHDYYEALINNIDWSGIIWCMIIGTAVAWRARLRQRAGAAATPAP
jgi:hypothetical protein